MIRFALTAAILASIVSPAFAQSSASPAKPAANPCADPNYGHFDFWVGKWDVYGPQGKQVANSLIEKVYGCGIRENWMPFSGGPGGSLSIYVPDKKGWQQFWIDSGGSRALFDGGWNGQAMVLTGEWGGPIVRMTYTKNADGSVRQFGEQSKDEGKTWAPSFDFTYRPHPADQPFPTPQSS